MDAIITSLNVHGWRCVVVGGGSVAARRARILSQAGAKVTVIAPSMDQQLSQMTLIAHARAYETGDLRDARLVVIATDDPALNDRIARDARDVGALVNRADKPEAGDVNFCAQGCTGPVHIGVHTGGISAAAAAAIRDELLDKLDPDWLRLLDTVAPFRDTIQNQWPNDGDHRRALLRKLTDTRALAILKQGGPAALAEHCRRIASGNVNATTR